MNFGRIIQPSAATFNNPSNSFIVLLQWGGSYTLTDSAGNTYSGAVIGNVATNNWVIIPPNFNLVATTAFFAYYIELTQSEFSRFLLGSGQ